MSEALNEARAGWAALAANAFTIRTYAGRRYDTLAVEEKAEALSDLVADILHLAERDGVNTTRLMVNAGSTWTAERLEGGS